jgi:hypothetical protein
MLVPALAAFCWYFPFRAPVVAGAPKDATPTAAGKDSFQWKGVSSCTAASCHNANEERGSKGSEYSTWVTYDPHATRAYTVLQEPRSQRIIKNLKLAGPAEQTALCLRCHAVDLKTTHGAHLEDVAEGVSCESCHGPAEKWLTVHYLKEWKDLPAAEKEKQGMKPTKDLVYRAKACVECHVGEKDRDVNHDLIAAGHPRMNFEFGAFLANMPKHWNEKAEKDQQSYFDARVWAIGQIVSARAALSLLADRAADPKKPWPEFAEYDCFACHHDLAEPSWRQKHRDPKRAPGSLIWGSWYYSLIPQAFKAEGAGGDAELASVLNGIREQMKQPLPPQKNVVDKARAAVSQLDALLKEFGPEHKLDPRILQGLLETLQKEDTARSWDEEAQGYLGQTALNLALAYPKAPDDKVKATLSALQQRLKFPKDYDSPKGYPSGK